jgi:outer membrane protein TolC
MRALTDTSARFFTGLRVGLPAGLAIGLWLGAAPARAEAPVPPTVPGGLDPLERIGLAEAVARALKQSPQLGAALDEARRADALSRQVRAAWLPTLGAAVVYTRLDSDRVAGATVTLPANALNASLSLSVPVFAPRAWLGWQVSRESAAAAQEAGLDVQRLVAVSVGRAYLAVLAQHRILEAARRGVADAQAHRDFAEQRFQGGVGPRLDLVRAQQQWQGAQAQAEQARSTLSRAQEALGVLVGEAHGLDVAGEPALPAPPPADQAEAAMEGGRRDLAALRLRSQVADHVVRNDWADFLPTVALGFQPFVQAPATVTYPHAGFQATAALSWALYDGGLRYGLQDERALLASEAHLAEEGAGRQARADVRAALVEVQRSDAGLAASTEAAKLAHEALELTRGAYQAGAGTNIEVIDAEKTALDADTQTAIAEDAARQARLDLLAATGRFP